MNKKTKVILISSALILSGIILTFVLNKGKVVEDLGVLPSDDLDVDPQNPQPIDSSIGVGDLITPYGEVAKVRTDKSIDDGFFFNNLYVAGRLEGVVYNGNIIGKVVGIESVGSQVWYKVNVCAIVNGVYDSVANVNRELAQDTCSKALNGYVLSNSVIKAN